MSDFDDFLSTPPLQPQPQSQAVPAPILPPPSSDFDDDDGLLDAPPPPPSTSTSSQQNHPSSLSIDVSSHHDKFTPTNSPSSNSTTPLTAPTPQKPGVATTTTTPTSTTTKASSSSSSNNHEVNFASALILLEDQEDKRLQQERDDDFTKTTGSSSERKKDGEAEGAAEKTETPPPAPPSNCSVAIWSFLMLLPILALIGTFLIISETKPPIEGGFCQKNVSEGRCNSVLTATGLTDSQIFGSGIAWGSGCSDQSQSCETTASAAQVYNDFNYARCWDNPNVIAAEAQAQGAGNNNKSRFYIPEDEKIWISPSQQLLGTDELNQTRAVHCCRSLPGGVNANTIATIFAKSFVGVFLDLILNLLMKIKCIAAASDLLMFIPQFVTMKLERAAMKEEEIKKEEAEQKRQRKIQRKKIKEEEEEERQREEAEKRGGGGDGGELGDTMLIPKSTIHATSAASVTAGGDGGDGGTEKKNAAVAAAEEEEDDEEEKETELNGIEDVASFLKSYSSKAALDRAAAIESLGASNWVDEAFLPSALLIIKSSCFCAFGFYYAIATAYAPSMEGATSWARYNAYSSAIVNGSTFGAWLDIGALSFVFYAMNTDIFRQTVQNSSWCIIKAMTDFVILMFSTAQSTREPIGAKALNPNLKTTRFFTDNAILRSGLRFFWVCYLASYVSHICAASFYYLPHLVVFFITVIPGFGLLCVAVAKLFDVYGDTWKPLLKKGVKIEQIPKWRLLRTFTARFLLAALYSVVATYLYTSLCNWFALLTEYPHRYTGASNYNRVFVEEWSLRSSQCVSIKLADAIEKGDTVAVVDSVLNYL